ncbi:MAG TPA: hypothetical protein VFQ59_00370 [Candidatus Paceibacterota bacterium]|nr:hypothetical protein [Candidatus Paceibacterota bacterium]
MMIVLLGIAIAAGSYYLGAEKSAVQEYPPNVYNDVYPEPVDDVKSVDNPVTPTSNVGAGSEQVNTENFNNQPGAVKSIQTNSSTSWTLAVDLLTHNPNWLPGVDSSGGFFINQNTMIRNLSVTNATKTYICGAGPDGNSTTADVLENTSSFLSSINANIKNKDYNSQFVGPTSYFDIKGTSIIAIYQQCLP